ASDAFGAYHHDLRDGESAGIGQESEFGDGALAFWKGRFFVSIIAFEDSPQVTEMVFELGRRISQSIREAGEPPELVQWLPEQDMLGEQLRYFHNHSSLERYHSCGVDNPLRLDQQTEGVICRYRPARAASAKPYALLLVRYPSASRAREALDELRRVLLGGVDPEGMARMKDESWAAARVIDDVIVAVFDAASADEARQAIERVARRSSTGAD
ncbi:MAG: hypothetical protein JSV80_03915, partial [Acidobacteriota bacterium]